MISGLALCTASYKLRTVNGIYLEHQLENVFGLYDQHVGHLELRSNRRAYRTTHHRRLFTVLIGLSPM